MNFLACIEKEFFLQYDYNILESTTDTIKEEILIIKNNKDKMWVEYTGKVVIYKGQKSFLAHLYDVTDKKVTQLNLSRISRLRALMLEVTQKIFENEGIEQIFQLILKNSLLALENSSVGTIFVKEYDYFTLACSVGFQDDINNYKLRCEDSFLYKATDGKMDRVINIKDLTTYDQYDLFKTSSGDGNLIKSTISFPIYLNGNLFGMANIDSVEKNAFDEVDVKSMEFIKNNVEIALSNHLLYKEKDFLAKYDSLTHLYNRRYFEEKFSLIIEDAVKSQENFQLVMFDIDDLKKINDSNGHLVGDEIIKKIAHTIESSTRKSDILARIGGDEFIAILFGPNQEFFIERLHKLLKKLEDESISTGDEEIKCSFSYGIASFPEEGETLEELIKIADRKMYAFKNEGNLNRN
jgi:diguanylate cyclase (GGDEF)-like protein